MRKGDVFERERRVGEKKKKSKCEKNVNWWLGSRRVGENLDAVIVDGGLGPKKIDLRGEKNEGKEAILRKIWGWTDRETKCY